MVEKGKGRGKFDVPKKQRPGDRPSRGTSVFIQDYEAKGYAKKTKDGKPICFNYNMSSCGDAQPGTKCSRGWHVCASPGCQSKLTPHSASIH